MVFFTVLQPCIEKTGSSEGMKAVLAMTSSINLEEGEVLKRLLISSLMQHFTWSSMRGKKGT